MRLPHLLLDWIYFKEQKGWATNSSFQPSTKLLTHTKTNKLKYQHLLQGQPPNLSYRPWTQSRNCTSTNRGASVSLTSPSALHMTTPAPGEGICSDLQGYPSPRARTPWTSLDCLNTSTVPSKDVLPPVPHPLAS